MDIKFDPGKPFKPFEQLMSVFPAARFVLLSDFTTLPDTDVRIAENKSPQCSMTL
jgi:5'-3' exonuclease